jgi:hypothetical protein
LSVDLVGIIVGLVSGLFGGAVGGVLTARRIAVGAERGRAQFEAEEAIRATVTVYRATVTFDHNQVFEVSHYAKEYTSVAGQEAFGAKVLQQVGHLGRRSREAIKKELRLLLGSLPYELAVQRAHVPEERLDVEKEKARQALVLHQVLAVEETTVDGLLRQMLATQNRGDLHHDLFRQATASLDRILAEVGAPLEKARGQA